VSFLVQQPILLLFAVVGVGSAIGRIRIGGFSLGPAAVLFCGLAASGIDHRLVLSEDILTLGLVLFTYVVGISAGPAFVSSLRGRGLRSVALVATMITAAVGVAVGLRHLMNLSSARGAGVFTGALTNTPALGAVIDHVGPKQAASAAVGYSLAYPIGVLGALVAAHFALRRAEPADAPEAGGTRSSRTPGLVAWTVRIREDGLPSLGELQAYGGGLAFGHHARGDHVAAASAETQRGGCYRLMGRPRRAASPEAQVVRAVDGDTIVVAFADGHTDTVRVLGVDTSTPG
jgi:putative transport protein